MDWCDVLVHLNRLIKVFYMLLMLVFDARVMLCTTKLYKGRVKLNQSSGAFLAQPAKIRPFTTSIGFLRI